jgi:hypothetical protein
LHVPFLTYEHVFAFFGVPKKKTHTILNNVALVVHAKPTSMHHQVWWSASTGEGANITQVLDVFVEDCEPFTIQLTNTNRVDTLHIPKQKCTKCTETLSATEGIYIQDELRRNAMKISPPVPKSFHGSIMQWESWTTHHLSNLLPACNTQQF